MTWLPIAFSAEVTSVPLARTGNGHAVVLFRTVSGTLACLEDRCAHRGRPLSTGKVRGEELECRYHLYRYDVSGFCTGAFDEPPPPGTRVPAFPVREQDGQVWVEVPAEIGGTDPGPGVHGVRTGS